MKKPFYLAILSMFIMSCEKTIPDPYPVHDPDPSKFYANQTILDSVIAHSIAFDSDGTAWIGTKSYGLIKYGLTQTKAFKSISSPHAIAVDSKNNLWMSSNGLVKFDGKKFTRYNTTNSNIPEDVVWSIAIDSNDEVWVASCRAGSGGIAKFDGASFKVFTPENSPLPIHLTHALAIDNEDNIWVASTQSVTYSYLTKISGESWYVYDSVDFNQKIFYISDIEINSKNEVYGTIDYSLSSGRYHTPHVFRFNGNEMETFELDSSLRIFAQIFIDSNDRPWCTYSSGYAYFDGETWERTDSEVIEVDGYSQYKTWFITIEQAPDGNIWIGTSEGIRIIEGINK